ncbi:helix-turn-helix domain-containing protein [Thetidibacter halocola]|uniref:Helix-turn-helix domain-containing protein n=1 Tax=Thetidibacter halocola TaxID=2827239 RepID=A0A8J7WA79_9RHOB|nr:helix-turn-helix domain-containing protein [Thetidibacter halocola]MBS0123785.1 helix-turn-helix domain-containing protein [Thetidibacter halocola]
MPHTRSGGLADAEDTPVRAERFRAALQTRVIGRVGIEGPQSFRALHLERGTGRLRRQDEDIAFVGPVLAWFPWTETQRVELGAGAQGTHLMLGSGALERALRQKPEAAQLRLLAGSPALLPLGRSDETRQAVRSCVDGILVETARAGLMGGAVIDSLLHVLLVLLYRDQPQATRAEAGGARALATRFTALVESHFRAHWTVQRYAAALGISRDRLNDICLRAYGRTPGALIRARLYQEARLYLENAPLSLDQIAALLGFSGTAQFSRFFKAQGGLPPGRYRASLRGAEGTVPMVPTAPYAWP